MCTYCILFSSCLKQKKINNIQAISLLSSYPLAAKRMASIIIPHLAMVLYLYIAWKTMVVNTFYAIVGKPYIFCYKRLCFELN